jgi:diketogulonate reductase-like aldo/keto reductase
MFSACSFGHRFLEYNNSRRTFSSMPKFNEMIRLHNGIEMPSLAFDTYGLTAGTAHDAVLHHLQCGGRHIDTSADFGVEKQIAAAIADSGIPRNELFLTDEIPGGEANHDAAVRAVEVSLKRLASDYVDLLLMGWCGGTSKDDPDNTKADTAWSALETVYKNGNAHSIGILDFQPWQIEYLLQRTEIVPMVSLVPIYPGYPSTASVKANKEHNFCTVAYLPRKIRQVLDSTEIHIFAEKYHTDPLDIVTQYVRQKADALTITVPFNEVKEESFRFSEPELKYLDVMKDYGV